MIFVFLAIVFIGILALSVAYAYDTGWNRGFERAEALYMEVVHKGPSNNP